MIRLVLIGALLTFAFAMSPTSQAQTAEGQIVISNCYQQDIIVPAEGGTFNVISGIETSFRMTLFPGIDVFDILEIVDGSPVHLQTVESDSGVIFAPDKTYEVTVSPYTDEGPSVTLISKPLEFTPVEYSGDGCIAFGETFDIQFDFPNLCGFEAELFNPFTNTTIQRVGNSFTVESDGYCTPPPGTDWDGNMICLNVQVIITLLPCDPSPDCPELVVTQDVLICCNDCQPFGVPSSEKTGGIGNIRNDGIGAEDVRNYPNPFADATTISFNLPESAEVTVEIVNLFGQVVAVKEMGVVSSGQQEVLVSAATLADGIYIYRVNANGVSIAKRMQIIR